MTAPLRHLDPLGGKASRPGGAGAVARSGNVARLPRVPDAVSDASARGERGRDNAGCTLPLMIFVHDPLLYSRS